MEDWFRSQKDMPDSEDQENLYASIGSYIKRDSPYEDIEFEESQSKAKILQTHTRDSHMEYIATLANAERADYTSQMTRSQSLPYSSKNNYTLVSEDSLECNSPQIPIRKHSQHAPLPPLPHLPKHLVNSTPTVDTSPAQNPSSPNTLASTNEELYIEILADAERADCTSEMTRSQSNPHLPYSSENNYTLVSEDSLGCNSPQIPIRKHSQHAPLPPLPHLPKHLVNSTPTVDTSPAQNPSSPNTLASTNEELYIEILADAERADCTSEMIRSQSNPHLPYSSKNNYTLASEDSLECNSPQIPIRKHSQHDPLPPLPHLPEHHVNSIPTNDTSPPQNPSSPNTLASTDEEAVSLCTTDISSQYKPRLSHSSKDIPDTTSNSTVTPKQVQTTSSLGCGTISQLRLKSHSSGQVNTLSALNKEVYHFISNSLHPERKENSQPSLNEIFGRYCQNEKAVSLNYNKLPSECSSLCSSVEPLSDNSGTASPVEQNARTPNGSRITLL